MTPPIFHRPLRLDFVRLRPLCGQDSSLIARASSLEFFVPLRGKSAKNPCESVKSAIKSGGQVCVQTQAVYVFPPCSSFRLRRTSPQIRPGGLHPAKPEFSSRT